MKQTIIVLLIVIHGMAESQSRNNSLETAIQNAALGSTAILSCRSNDKEHNFRFWQLPQNGGVIGPGNVFDNFKYGYEVLTGKLIIKKVSTQEDGIYHCVSEGVTNSDVNIRSVRMKVNQEESTGLNYFKGVAIVVSLMVAAGLCYVVQRYRKRRRLQRLLEASSDEDDDSGEELFTTPRTSGESINIVINKPDDQESLVEIEIPKISVDLDGDLINKHK